jgi:hypothetical protein
MDIRPTIRAIRLFIETTGFFKQLLLEMIWSTAETIADHLHSSVLPDCSMAWEEEFSALFPVWEPLGQRIV